MTGMCKREIHPMEGDNIAYKVVNQIPRPYCLTCYREEKAAAGWHRESTGLCRRGLHPMEGDNIGYKLKTLQQRPYCLACYREKVAANRARRDVGKEPTKHARKQIPWFDPIAVDRMIHWGALDRPPTIPEREEVLRRVGHLSNAELAEMFGVPTNTVGRWRGQFEARGGVYRGGRSGGDIRQRRNKKWC